MRLRPRLAALVMIGSLLSPCAGIASEAAGTPASAGPATADQHRPESRTLMTFPEWFLVYSPAEFADLVAGHAPDRFPYAQHVIQFWQAYLAVWLDARQMTPPPEAGDHVMDWVIGLSTSVEYLLKAAYEALIGSLTDATGDARTDEDRFAAGVAREYVDFIRLRPWYEFDFGARLMHLWTDLPAFGPDLPRKWERRWLLTNDYAIKAAYGWLIGRLTAIGYSPESQETEVIIAAPDMPQGPMARALPRYQPFTDAALDLARQGWNFEEIAGNRGRIAVSVLAPQDWSAIEPNAPEVLRQPILTVPGRSRILMTLPVDQLSQALRQWPASGATIEHVYDY